MKYLATFIALVAALAAAHPTSEFTRVLEGPADDPRLDVWERNGKFYRHDGEKFVLAEIARFQHARGRDPRVSLPEHPHWGGCPAPWPDIWPQEVLGLWVQDHMDNLENGRNFPWKWYTGNQSFGSNPSNSYGKIGSTFIDQNYLLGDTFENNTPSEPGDDYPAPSFAGEMSVGDKVFVFWSLNHAGYTNHDGTDIGVTCLNNEWNFVGTPLLGWQVANLNITHPAAPAGTAYTHSALMLLDVPDDPGLNGVELYRQAWFWSVSEQVWTHALHGEVIVLWE